jgi:hypothetical protein
MIAKEFTLVFKNRYAYLIPDNPLSFERLGLKEFENTSNKPAYWIIKVLNHIEPEKRIFCSVLSYHTGETDFPANQLLLANKLKLIETVSFRSIDTAGLLKTLAPKTIIPANPLIEIPEHNYESEPHILREPVRHYRSVPEHRTIEKTFFVPLKEIRFILGGAVFSRYFREYDQTTEVIIQNYYLREEFDAVKNYFTNALQTRKIQVRASLKVDNNKIVSVTASSPEIEKIDNQLIENIKFDFVKNIKKKVLTDVDKSLFTMEEYFETFGEGKLKPGAFYQDEKELFEDIMKITQTKHYRQLRFLSENHCYRTMKLRFVQKPFSFLFLLEGEKNYHIVWETLDTEEATYIWHAEKNIQALKPALKKVEDIINVIKVQGKTAYINTTNDPFRRIYHDYSDFIDGFVKWKGELENILT